MVTLFCAIVGVASSAFPVDIDAAKTVGHLKKAIKAEKMYQFPADELKLFLTKKADGGWLTEADVKNGVGTDGLKALKTAGAPLKLYGLTETSVQVEITLDMVESSRTPVHVLVVLPKRPATDRDEDMPPAKRAKADQVEVPYQGPVPEEFYSVPMETIDTYQKLQAAFLSRNIAPLCLLYGPRQFGKTTIGLRLRTLLAAEPSIRVIYISLSPSAVKTEEDFWLALSRTVGEKTRSSEEFDMMFSCHKRRLWLAIDEMDNMFQNEELTSNFMETLRGWQAKKYFVGFLGIGSHDLLTMHMKLKGGRSASPFNLGEVFQAKPFSKKQMKGYFKQIQARYPFRKSTRKAIMAYSAGAPGVFGSLIRYSIDCAKCDQERYEWEHWFKIQNFSNYLDTHNWTYGKIRMDLQKLGQADWYLLSLLLQDTASEVREDFGASRKKLLQMGVVIDCHGTTELKFSSQMMRRLCFEALPIREIRGVASTDDPLELLAVSLRFMNPESIRHVSVKKKLSPSESVFQFELYAAIRGIFAANNTADKHVLPEARDPYDPQNRRLDIIISNGKKYGYELKADQLNEADIVAAVRQADGYRQLLKVDVMFVVNFIPQGHTLRKQVFKVETYSDVQVIHVFFPDTCDEYTLQHQDVDGTIKDRTICCGGRAKALPSFS